MHFALEIYLGKMNHCDAHDVRNSESRVDPFVKQARNQLTGLGLCCCSWLVTDIEANTSLSEVIKVSYDTGPNSVCLQINARIGLPQFNGDNAKIE